MIDGVHIQELKQIVDERGKVMHMLRADSPAFTKFGEIYFSKVNPGMVKAWKRHFKMTQHLAVPCGEISLVMYDDRENSPTREALDIISFGEDDYRLVSIPPLLWYGFKGVSTQASLIANCADMPHDPEEVERIKPDDKRIPYIWK